MSKTVKSPYLTKELLNRAVKSGIKVAAAQAKKKVDVIIVEENGWIVSKHRDGTITKLDKIERPSRAEVKKKVAQLVHG